MEIIFFVKVVFQSLSIDCWELDNGGAPIEFKLRHFSILYLNESLKKFGSANVLLKSFRRHFGSHFFRKKNLNRFKSNLNIRVGRY